MMLALVGSAAVAEAPSESINSATPAAAVLEVSPSQDELRGILHDVLELTHVPLRHKNVATQIPRPIGVLKVADRRKAVDGWRASGLHLSPLLLSSPLGEDPRSPQQHDPSATTEAVEVKTPDDAAKVDEANSSKESTTAREKATVAPRESSDFKLLVPPPPDPPTEPLSDLEAPEVAPQTDAEPADIPDDSASPLTDSDADRAPNPELNAEDPGEAAADEAADNADENADQPGDATTVAPPVIINSPPPPLTRQLMNLRSRVRSVLKGYYRKPLNSREHDAWEAMHGMLAYGIHSRILQGSPRGTPITAVGWLCYNKPCKGLTLLYVTPEGELRAKWGVGLQGHTGQFLAMLAQCDVSPEYPIHVGKQEFTIRDLIDAEKTTCYPKSELTFKLIAFQHYLDLDEKWVNDQGLDWDMPRLIREELAQPIRGAACGGTHRLSGLSLSVKARQRRGEPLDGEYARAADFIQKYHSYAFRLQNRDGSLSTEWFRGRGDDEDKDRRIKTTGHILEWLCYSLSDEELRQPRTIRAVAYLANLMYSNYDHEWEVGPRSHAIHALIVYDERVFRPFDNAGDVVSYKPQPSTANRSRRRSPNRR
jgi:hypothetical protein